MEIQTLTISNSQGGGDSAVEEATFLTRFAKKVYLLIRSNKMR